MAQELWWPVAWKGLDFQVETPTVVIESANISAGKKEPEKSSIALSLSGLQCKENCGGFQCPLELSPLGLQDGQFPLGQAARSGWRGDPKHGVPLHPSASAPHPRQHRRSCLGLSSEHRLSALNLRSHHTLRSGEGPPVSGQGKVEGAGCHFVISRASKAGRHREVGGEELRGHGGLRAPCPASPRAGSPGAQLLREEGAPGKRRDGGGRVGKATLPMPFTPEPAKFGVQVVCTIFSGAGMRVRSTPCGLEQLLKEWSPLSRAV